MIKSKMDKGNFWILARQFFGSYLSHIRNLSPNSIDAYKQSLKDFIAYLEKEQAISRKNITIETFSRKIVQQYITHLKTQRKLAPKTCSLRLTAIKAFLKYCSEESFQFEACFREVSSIKSMKLVKQPVKYLSEKAMRAILKMPRICIEKERRNQMILIFLYDSAVRVQELVNIELKDLHLNENSPFVTIRNGKGNKLRNIPLMAKSVEHLKSYIAEFHGSKPLNSTSPLFYSMRDDCPHSLTTDSIRIILKKYVEMARKICPDIPREVSCHMIRKTRAMDLYRNGIPLPYIMEILGHESEATTKTFYAFATIDTLYEALIKTHPEITHDIPLWKTQEALNRLYSFG